MRSSAALRERHAVLDAYRKVLRFIHQNELKVGDRLPPHAQLTRRVAVSHFTLDVAMRWLTEDGVVRRRPRSGTTLEAIYPENPKRSLWRVGIVTPPLTASFFFPVMVQFLHRHLGRFGVSDRTYMLRNDAPPGSEVDARRFSDFSGLQEDVADGMLDGILTSTRLRGKGIPVCGAPMMDPLTLGVRVDHAPYVREAARMLREQGCRRIALVAPVNSEKLTGSLGSAGREFVQTKEAQGCIFELTICRDTNDAAFALCAEWLARPVSRRPDGVVFQNDVLAHAFAAALARQLGYRPVLATTANVQIPLPFAVPALQFKVDIDAIAAAAVELLLEKLLNPRNPDRRILVHPIFTPDEQPAFPFAVPRGV